VANLEFGYLDSDGGFTEMLSSVKRVRMTLSLDIAGSAVLRVYEAVMRNRNEGVKTVPVGVDFDEIESKYFNK